MKKTILSAGLAVAMLSGCSSIVSKSSYPVTIASTPEGASFTILNKAGESVQNGITPTVVTLKASAGFFKGETYTLELEKEGYAAQTYTLNSSVDGWYFGNILLGGLLGMLIIDPATGAMYKLEERVDITLRENVAANVDKTLSIATIDALDEEQKSRLVRIY